MSSVSTSAYRQAASPRSTSADTAVRLSGYFGNRPRFWLDLQSQHDIAVIERVCGPEITRRVPPGGPGADQAST